MHRVKYSMLGVVLVSLILTGCPDPRYNEAREISNKDALMYIDAFRTRNEPSFALSYLLDMSVLRQMGDNASSLYVIHGLGDDNRRVIILGPVNEDAELIPEGPYFMQSDINLCPPYCDASFSAATLVDKAVAERYAERFRSSGLDELRAFIIPRRTIDVISRSTSVRNLKVFNAIEEGKRALVVAGAGPRGETVNTSIYLQDETTLCPPYCDVDGSGATPTR